MGSEVGKSFTLPRVSVSSTATASMKGLLEGALSVITVPKWLPIGAVHGLIAGLLVERAGGPCEGTKGGPLWIRSIPPIRLTVSGWKDFPLVFILN